MNNAIRHQSPQRPADRSGAASLRGRDVFVRAAASATLEAFQDKAGDRLRARYEGDAATMTLCRAATSSGTIALHGALAQTAVADFVTGLAPSSAGAALIASGMTLDGMNHVGLSVPGIAQHPTLAFVAEGAPIPFASFPFSAGTLLPHKIAGAVAYTRSLARHSGFEDAVRLTLNEALGLSLDAVLFGTAAGSTTAPAGLLNGITPITAEAGGDEAAMIADLTALGAAVAPVAGDQITFVVAPRQAVKIALKGPKPFPYELRASAALADGTVIAVASGLLASWVDETPEFQTSAEGLFHMSDDPLPIVAGVTADPVRSAWQTDCLVLRVILGISWTPRTTGGVAFVASAS